MARDFNIRRKLRGRYTGRSRRAAELSAKLTLGRIRQLLAKHRIPRWTAEQIAEILLRPWALVGDAGYNQDPITAQGISDAFFDADALTTALDEGWSARRPLDVALTEYQSSRDQRAKPMYDFTCQQATLEPPPPQMQRLFAALHGNQEATNRFYSALAGSTPLPEFMNPENIDRIVASAGNRG